jgi:hypothetical protein
VECCICCNGPIIFGNKYYQGIIAV